MAVKEMTLICYLIIFLYTDMINTRRIMGHKIYKNLKEWVNKIHTPRSLNAAKRYLSIKRKLMPQMFGPKSIFHWNKAAIKMFWWIVICICSWISLKSCNFFILHHKMNIKENKTILTLIMYVTVYPLYIFMLYYGQIFTTSAICILWLFYHRRKYLYYMYKHWHVCQIQPQHLFPSKIIY